MSSHIAGLSEQELWQNFYNLSLELKKFLEQNESDMFLEILRQRSLFEKKIYDAEPVYIKTPEGQELLKKIIAVNRQLISSGENWLNKTRRGFNIEQQYETLGVDMRGLRLDGRG